MIHQRYFLVIPRPELVSRLAALGASDLMDLAEPVLWKGEEPDKGFLSHSDMEVLVKVLFVDVLCRERSADRVFREVFAGIEATETYFDSQWQLKRVDLDMTTAIALEDAVRSGTIARITRTGNETVDKYLRGVCQQRVGK